MFCPKCGNQVPDGAAFCGQCGNKFENAPSAPTGTPASAGTLKGTAGPSATPSLKLTPVGIAAAIVAVVALIFSFMPWFEISSQMSMVSGAASGIASGVSSLFGGSSTAGSSLSFEDSYAVWNLIGMADSFKEYANIYSSFGGSKASGAVVVTTLFSWACLILWLVSLVLTIWGAIAAFAKGSVGILRTSSILMIVTVVVFYIFAMAMGSDTGSANAMPVLCLILSIVSFVCSFMAKKTA